MGPDLQPTAWGPGPCSALHSCPCPCSVRREPLSGQLSHPRYTVAPPPRGLSDFPAELLDPTPPRGLGAPGVLPLLELWLLVDTGYPALAMRPKLLYSLSERFSPCVSAARPGPGARQ